jgi:hypothetical protein
MRKLSILPLLLLPGLILGQAPSAVETTFANKREFRIPFNPGPNAQNLKQLQLFVSADQGKSWASSAIVAPDQQRFHFLADRDGVFWFAVQTLDLKGNPFPPTMDGVPPSLKVVVDTQPPAVQVQPLAPRPGEVGVGWTIRDDNFDPALAGAVVLEYRLAGALTWQVVPIAAGATQAYWNPKANTLVDVRLKARDRAGNVGEGLTTTSLGGAGQGLPSPVNDVFPPPASASPRDGDLQKLGAKDRRFVNSKRVVLNCELKDFGPSGVSLVELWYTHDARSWSRGPEFKVPPGDEQGKQAITFDVATEGVYGLTLLARSGVGLGDRPPQVGDRPQLWIEVDTTKPAVKLAGVVVGNGADKGKLTINWSAFDKNPMATPISLSYAEKADGPWKAFAEKLPNNGRYVWSMPPDGVPYQFHVKVEAVDLAGNIGEAITPDLIKVDLSTPKVRILNVEPSGK